MTTETVWNDPTYLREEQYRDSSRLAARANLHGYGRGDWFAWVAGQAPWPAGGRVLELGCGAGWLWAQGAEQIPADLHVTLTDLSDGMVGEALARMRSLGRAAEGRPADAAALPFEAGSFDLVLALHMLYHLPDPIAGVDEIVRVLKPGGIAVIATNGADTMSELFALKAAAFGGPGRDDLIDGFNLENSRPVLEARFGSVEFRPYDDVLRITEPEDVYAYHTSGPPGDAATPEQAAALRSAIAAAFEAGGGVMAVRKSVGVFVCRKA